jgi:hypothetical protein
MGKKLRLSDHQSSSTTKHGCWSPAYPRASLSAASITKQNGISLQDAISLKAGISVKAAPSPITHLAGPCVLERPERLSHGTSIVSRRFRHDVDPEKRLLDRPELAPRYRGSAIAYLFYALPTECERIAPCVPRRGRRSAAAQWLSRGSQ